ncbi:MAG TPA: GNAT family N-acetyltransferase [Acidimicrobiales bacterium]|jgi:GNAT superfamily N-acetyltransferase|nr:GNAT family N-acetyltransferase [Acidimicrobiales bacterium]
MPEVRPAGPDDIGPLAAMLSRAFEDDPVADYLMPSAERRPAGLRSFFSVQMAKDLLAHGGVFTTEDRSGAALWAPPGKPPLPMGRALANALPVLPYVIGRNFLRSIRFLAHIEAIHPKEPHWYLATLGTDPPRQGQGIGSALLAPVLRRCDLDGVRAYLESSKADNVPFYRRHGFEVTGEVRLAGGPPVWTMWREPRPPEG